MRDEASSRIRSNPIDLTREVKYSPKVHKKVMSTNVANNIILQPDKLFCKVFIVSDMIQHKCKQAKPS